VRFFSIHQMPPVPRRPPRGQGEPRQYYFLSLTHRQNRRQQSESFDIKNIEQIWKHFGSRGGTQNRIHQIYCLTVRTFLVKLGRTVSE
jgi:hypothetical protein